MKKLTLIVLIVGVVAIGYYIVTSRSQNAAAPANQIGTTEFNGAVGPSDPADETYVYSECSSGISHPLCWAYKLLIYHQAEPKILVSIDGFQTMVRLGATLKANGNVVFDEYRSGDIVGDNADRIKTYQPGDVLFIMQKQSSGEYLVVWKKLQSNITNSKQAVFYREEASK